MKRYANFEKIRFITLTKWVVALGLPIICFLPVGLKDKKEAYLPKN